MRRAAEATAAAAGEHVGVQIRRRRIRRLDITECTFVDGVLTLKRNVTEPLNAAEADDAPVMTQVREVLTSLADEPNNVASIKAAYEHIGKVACVRGFVPPDKVQREWVAVVSDQGALARSVLDSENTKFARILHIPGTGHESTLYLRSVNNLLNSFGFEAILADVYAASPGAIGYLMRGTDVHQVRDWILSVASPALWRAAAREYIRATRGDVDCAGFEVWMRSNRTDPRFAFVSDLLEHWLPALRCVHVGIRNNDHVNYTAGRLELLSLLFSRGAKHYGPLVVRDRADMDFLNSDEVREWRYSALSCENGEGADYNLEEVHLVLQAGSPGIGRNDWTFGSTFFDLTRDARMKLQASLGMPPRYVSGSRPPLDLSDDRAAVERHLWHNRSLQPDVSSGATFRDLQGHPLAAGASNLRALGVEEVGKAAAAFIAGEHYVVRKAVRLTAREVVEEPVAVHSPLTACKAELELRETEVKAMLARVHALQAAQDATTTPTMGLAGPDSD